MLNITTFKVRKLINNLKYKFSWLGIVGTPFKRPSASFYFGKIKHGTPHFLPRKWVPISRGKAWEKTHEHYAKLRKAHLTVGAVYKAATIQQIRDKVDYFQRCREAIPKKWGIDIVPLGWKTKFDSYRHEWNPLISIVGFNRQFCIFFSLKSDDSLSNMCYWEAWLYYKHKTDKNKSKDERIKETIKNRSVTWGNSNKGYTDYYKHILKKKYLKYMKDAGNI